MKFTELKDWKKHTSDHDSSDFGLFQFMDGRFGLHF